MESWRYIFIKISYFCFKLFFIENHEIFFLSYFQLKEIEIDKSIPRDVNGIAIFNPFWFSDGSMTLKQESIEVELNEGMK